MPRRNIDKKVGGHCKIRKRGCYSSSSTTSSSLAKKNYRLKRAILVEKRAGSSTPVPSWKMVLRSPVLTSKQSHGDKGKEAAQLSARRLAATLWEINGLQSPVGDGAERIFQGEKTERESKSLGKVGRMFGAEVGYTHLLDQSHSPIYEKKDGSKAATGHRRRPSSAASQRLELTEYIGGAMNSIANGGSIEVTSDNAVESAFNAKSRLKDVSKSLKTSKELVKVLLRMWGQEERNSSRLTLVSALRVELDRARLQVEQLIHEHQFQRKEIDSILKQFAAEKAAWKCKEQDRILNAISSVSREVEIEKKLRKRAERLNKRLGRELAESRAHLSRAVKELNSERKEREILEQTCNELATGVGEDRVEVEELKRESAKLREEVEKERQMLQLADVLREERVQMKLQEARYEYEEKNAALERLRNELEIYLGTKPVHGNRDRDDSNDDEDENGFNLPNNVDRNKEMTDFLRNIQRGSCLNGKGLHNKGELPGEEEDSGDSELQSIELNMDNLNKCYKWSFPGDGDALQADSRRASSVEEVFKGRRSLSEKIQWESICLQKKTSNANTEWDLNKKQVSRDGTDKGRLSGASSQGERNDQKSFKG